MSLVRLMETEAGNVSVREGAHVNNNTKVDKPRVSLQEQLLVLKERNATVLKNFRKILPIPEKPKLAPKPPFVRGPEMKVEEKILDVEVDEKTLDVTVGEKTPVAMVKVNRELKVPCHTSATEDITVARQKAELKKSKKKLPTHQVKPKQRVQTAVSQRASLQVQGFLTKEHVPFECCRVCRGFDSEMMKEQWIFCIRCGDSFHRACAHAAPAVDHPIRPHLPPGCYEPWYWECPDCRKCPEVDHQADGRTILCCFSCHRNCCQRCDPVMDLSFGFYYYCADCRDRKMPRHCLNCDKILHNSDHSKIIPICAPCMRRKACPRCHGRYSSKDWTLAMVGCSGCDSWTHVQCLGLTHKAYEQMGSSNQPFYCASCEATDPDRHNIFGKCAVCDGITDAKMTPMQKEVDIADGLMPSRFVHKNCANQIAELTSAPPTKRREGLWLRRGCLAAFIPAIRHDRDLVIKLSTWSNVNVLPNQRMWITFKAKLNTSWRLIGVEISLDRGAKFSGENFGEGFFRIFKDI